MLKFFTRLARELNWARRNWSTESDRDFHEGLYRTNNYDPFSWGYPGYTTIRRFADIVEPSLPEHGLVVDIGCGPGEITCELATRRPDLTFIGIDHSSAAIAKAQANARRRSATNVGFECQNVETYVPVSQIDLATLFDSFHHLIRPSEFISRLSPRVRRWALIEPRGSWAGTWQKDIDFDWLAHDLERIRARIAASVESASSPRSSAAHRPNSTEPQSDNAKTRGVAVERRYTLDDFRRFFDGYALDLRGTVAGLESYPPGSNEGGALRERFGELRYQLYRDLDEWLLERNVDLHAKHWLIVAERGGRSREVQLTNELPDSLIDGTAIAGQFDVEYNAYGGPHESRAGERVFGTVRLTNRGWDTWASDSQQIFVSYHWLDSRGRMVLLDGERTPLPRPIRAGESCEAAILIRTPLEPGRYRLAIDLVREGVTWFSEAGHPWLSVPFDVKRAR